ncbi:unnamed protein product [Ilex paraguariensis]|uniref:Aminotransferase-like plant mobile domain-containing protein n=1 Tax=Ilex paraguariensis TaxID=185542 RepID=A0ABC8SZR4_9AQUA
MGSGDPFEHEAFLALWLSRYVFTLNYDTIEMKFVPTAVQLSRGTPITIAPAVLASIYRDLTLLKKSLINGGLRVSLWAPCQLLQLWAWERFPNLSPHPMPSNGKLRVEDVRKAIDSAEECFLWRPYATVVNNWEFSKFYSENEDSVLVESEQYLPHRVSMQFGIDQGLPGSVLRFNMAPELAWSNYNRPIRDAMVYIPSRLSESDVTTQYLQWWNWLMLAREEIIKGVLKKQHLRNPTRLPRVFLGKQGR